MKKFLFLTVALLAVGTSLSAAGFGKSNGSGNSSGPDFDIKKVDVAFVSTPEYQVVPAAKQSRAQKWMVVEVSFDAKPDVTDELTFNYYIIFAKRLFVGHVSHVSIQKVRELHSVAYIAPKTIAQILGGKQVNASDLENVSVTITLPSISAAVATKSWKPSKGEWWSTMKQEEGFVLNKSQTPFAPLAWDYYEALKPAAASK